MTTTEKLIQVKVSDYDARLTYCQRCGYELVYVGHGYWDTTVRLPEERVEEACCDLAEGPCDQCGDTLMADYDAIVLLTPSELAELTQVCQESARAGQREQNSYCSGGDHRVRCPEDLCPDCGCCERHCECGD